MRRLWVWLTSWPMAIVDHCDFIDAVTGRSVLLCRDRHGRLWMAESRWDVGRVGCFKSMEV